MSIADKPARRTLRNRQRTTGVLLLTAFLALALIAGLPAVAGADDGAPVQEVTETNETSADSTEPSPAQNQPDAEFTAQNEGTISGVLTLDRNFNNNYPANPGDVTIEGTITGDSWSADSVQIADKEVNGTSLSLDASNLGGTYVEGGTFTVEGSLELTAKDIGETVSFSVSAGGSVDQNGAASATQNTQGNDPFQIPPTSDDSVNARLGLPTDDNIFVLDLTFDVTQIEYGDVDGTVADEKGNPVEGATVSVAGRSTQTDANGNYQFTGIETGQYTLDVEAGGYQDSSTSVTVQADSTATKDVTLQTLYDVTGQIVDGEDDTSIEGATVELGGMTATTGANGEYRFNDVVAGSYDLSVNARGYESRNTGIRIEENTELELGLTPRVAEVSVEAAGGTAFPGDRVQLSGEVTNEGDQPGKVNAELTLAGAFADSKSVILGPGETLQLSDSFSASNDNAGTFTVEVTANGESARGTATVKEDVIIDEAMGQFTATNTGDGYISFDQSSRSSAVSEGVNFPEGEILIEGEIGVGGKWSSTNVNFPTLETSTGLPATVATPRGLGGQIDREAGQLTATGPLQVTVDVEGQPTFGFSIEATTGDSGSLSGSANIGGNSGSALLVDNQFTVPTETDNTVVNQALGLPLTESGAAWLELGLDISFGDVDRATGSVTGTVTDESGDPVDGATVSVGSNTAETSSDGTFQIEGVRTGTTQLSIEAEGYVSETIETNVTEGETADVSAELAQGEAQFDVQVDSASGTVGETVSVTATVENSGTVAGETTVSFSADGLFDVEETVEVGASETATVTADLTPSEDDIGEYTATATAADSSAEASVSIREDTGQGVVGGFTATNTGEGFISFDEPSDAATAREEGLAFPGDEIEIEGKLFDDGTWESTSVNFPELAVREGVVGNVSVPNGFEGEYDASGNFISAEALLEVEVLAGDERQSQGAFQFSVAASSEDSNGAASDEGLSGSADLTEESNGLSGTTTLVDNEYIADDTTGSPVVDPVLGLPITEPGRNWLELHLELEPNDVGGGSPSGPSQDNVAGGFDAVNTGEGFISFDEPSDPATAREEGLAFPGEEIEIEGLLFDDGTWESTDVAFPELAVREGVVGSVSVPNGFEGEYDADGNFISAEALLEVEVLAGDQRESQGAFQFSVAASSEDSNGAASDEGLSGSADLTEEEDGLSGTTTLVDNEYIADDTTGSAVVDPVLGLPITEPGRNWLELHLELEPREVDTDGPATGSITGTVTDEAGEPITDATVSVGEETATTDDSGAYEVSGVETGEQAVTANAEGYSEAEETVQVVDGEAAQLDISLAAGEAEFAVDVTVTAGAPGETTTVEATVSNNGNAEGTEELTFSFGDETQTESVTLGPGGSETIATEWTPGEAGEYEVGVAASGGESLAQQSVTVSNESESEADFVATSTGGYVGFGYESASAAREEGVLLPEGVQIAGAINDEEGTWESTETFFPSFEATENNLQVDIEAPNGLSGSIDFEEELFTVEGTLRVTVVEEATFEYEIAGTTGESGALTGNASFDREAEEGTATIVENEHTIEEDTENAIVNSALSLPSTESGTNWFELPVELDFSGNTTVGGGNGSEASQNGGGGSLVRTFGLVGGALALGGVVVLIGLLIVGRASGGTGQFRD